MNTTSPLWPAVLDHIRFDSPDPDALADFYRDGLGMAKIRIAPDLYLMNGPQRRLLIGKGEKNGQPFAAFSLQSDTQLRAVREMLLANDVELQPSPTPLFRDDALAVKDPDGRIAVFCLPADNVASGSHEGLRAAKFSGRLQHVVVATTDLDRLGAFYEKKLGFTLSDTVCAGEETGPDAPAAVNFYRADVEHHSFAAFLAKTVRSDHHCYETTCWNDIRDWADHLAEMGCTPWWGPGRHGVGRNLFFMAKDPDGNNFELSAELEHMPRIMPPRRWPNTQATGNAWGKAWDRMKSTGADRTVEAE
ncbi:VOC family protein [Noviherbaspirillum denitrificans]|uniref:VOC domain-containing protein n=1 Tax=Noviherbaspirillum denitrificans TaxID=1968433 RepID=A0A254TEY3_9BURK|nr:VOC family protein [Noviherbaspirillum denitrificans]OWW21216.1 hypothetical protein AYR66_18785 [Noviherbaspirillum denitrificans]